MQSIPFLFSMILMEVREMEENEREELQAEECLREVCLVSCGTCNTN